MKRANAEPRKAVVELAVASWLFACRRSWAAMLPAMMAMVSQVSFPSLVDFPGLERRARMGGVSFFVRYGWLWVDFCGG